MSLRFSLAKAAGAVSTWGLRHVAHRPAANLPGKIALAIDPDLLDELRGKCRQGSVITVGTNGKTSTNNLLADAFEVAGRTIICNRTGANLAAGITSALLQQPAAQWAEAALHYLIRFVAAKALVGYGMDIMLNIFSICNGVITDMTSGMGGISQAMVSLPGEMQTAIENVGFLASIPLWLVTILGSLFITVLSFVMILTVYGRFFRLYMYTALAPLPLASFAGESTQSVGISFVKSYIGVCLEGAVIVLACIIYSAFVSTPTVTGSEPTTMVWSYLAETVFNMLVLVGLVKGSDRIIHEMMGL